MSAPLDPTTCNAQNLCWSSSAIDYVGADGTHYSASVTRPAPNSPPPTVTATAGANPMEGTPQVFSAASSSTVGLPITYQWQFEQPSQSGIICIGDASVCPISYGATVSGAQVSHTRPTNGTFHVQLTATNAYGQPTVGTFTVIVGSVPPREWLNHPAQVNAGDPTTLTGEITHGDSSDSELVTVNWGDGAHDTAGALTAVSSTETALSDTHTYAAAGTYKITVTVIDQDDDTASANATAIVQDTTVLSWRAPTEIIYGTMLGTSISDLVNTKLVATATTTIWQQGTHISTATAPELLADAALVYANLGGSGSV